MKKLNRIKATTKVDFATYLGVTLAFLIVSALQSGGMLSNAMNSWLVPICCFIVMAVSLNLVVGISGELSLGHGGFMSVGAFSGIVAGMSLAEAIPLAPLRLAVAILVGAACAAVAGFLIGIPVLRLRGDYLAIVTLAFGQIIKDLITCLLVGYDKDGLHIVFNLDGLRTVSDLHLEEGGVAIIKGAQGAVGITKMSSFTAGYILVMVTLVIVLNLIRSRTGRAIMAIRDNRIAAESVGLNVTKYKMIAFVVSAALAGAAGALFGLNYSGLVSSRFDFNTSIMVLVYVVLGGLGNIWGSVIGAAVLYALPEALRGLQDYRMLIYAIVLILVMLATNSDQLKGLLGRLIPGRKEKTNG